MFFAGGSAEFSWFTIGSLIVNFALLLFLVPKVIRSLTGRTPGEHLVASRESLAKQLDEAKVKQEAAEKRLDEYARKLANLEAEVDAIVKSYEAQGEADRARLEQDAEKTVDSLVRQADFKIRQKSLEAQKAIRAAAVESTLVMAEQLVRDRITDADRRRLTDEYISAVESGAAN